MEPNTADPRSFQVIQSYGDGGFRISGVRHEGAVLVFPSRTVAWTVQSPQDLTSDCFGGFLDTLAGVEVLLIGTGPKISMLPPGLRSKLRERAIGLEVMDTGAACRTYNVLLAEGRPVAAALMAVG
jgi:uncharacterized protein